MLYHRRRSVSSYILPSVNSHTYASVNSHLRFYNFYGYFIAHCVRSLISSFSCINIGYIPVPYENCGQLLKFLRRPRLELAGFKTQLLCNKVGSFFGYLKNHLVNPVTITNLDQEPFFHFYSSRVSAPIASKPVFMYSVHHLYFSPAGRHCAWLAFSLQAPGDRCRSSRGLWGCCSLGWRSRRGGRALLSVILIVSLVILINYSNDLLRRVCLNTPSMLLLLAGMVENGH